jgi:hypothetical protein
MNYLRFAAAVAAIFVFALLWNGFVHLVLLRDAELALEAVARPAVERNLPLLLALTLGIACLFVSAYAAVARRGGIRQGLMVGAFFGLFAGLLVDLNQYLLYPIPGSLAFYWFVAGFIEFCLYGVLAAWLHPVGTGRAGSTGSR